VFAKLDVQESEKAKQNENPGGGELMERVGGKNTGVPFFAFLDAKGEMIVNALRPVEGKQPSNIGHPFAPEEVDWFMAMIKKARPSITVADARVVEDWLRGQKQRDAEALSKELAELYRADQADRENWPNMSRENKVAVGERDTTRRKRVTDIVRAGQLATADDYYNAAMVFQHGDKPEEYLLAHELATTAAFKGRTDAKWLSAAALDRFLQSIGRPQRFGTQFKTTDDSTWTQEPFDRSLPDSVRKEFNVPALREQKKQFDELNKRKPGA
jgi:hypothetical protein